MPRMLPTKILLMLVLAAAFSATLAAADETWPQMKYDCRHSGNVPDRSVAGPLGLVGAVALTDAVFTSPAIAHGRVYVVDGSGVAFCFNARTLAPVWKFATRGGADNCNNISSPAIIGDYVHFGTMAGTYYVLDAADGSVVKQIDCGEPIFSCPVVSQGRVYFTTLSSRVYALEPGGEVAWTWDFVAEQLGFQGDRYRGEDWLQYKQGRVTWRDAFCCSRNIAARGKTVVVPAGGYTVWLKDSGDRPELEGLGLIPAYAGSEYPATFGQSLGEDGTVYRQWHRRDNTGRVEMLRLAGGEVQTDFVPGTQTAINLPGLLSFSSVSLRGKDVYRCRPEAGFGLSKHLPGEAKPVRLGGYPSIAAPILTAEQGVYGGLDGSLYVVPLSGSGEVRSFKTAFASPITAPAAICDGRIYFGCEDGYLYVLGSGGKAPLPKKDLGIWKIRSPLTGARAGSDYDWFANYANFANTNSNDQGVEPPFEIRWIRRYEGTFKHLPVCGGGRLYTHTAEGQIFAVEEETGRLLWRRYWPDVHLSFTSPVYYQERILVPQAGIKRSRLRCLEAKTGNLLWEVPFTGSPSWSRQAGPVIHENLAIYAFGSGRYAPQGTEKAYLHKGTPVESADGAEVMSWIYSHNNPYYPSDNKPLVRAWDLATGREVWEVDLSKFGSGGNDCGLCLMDGKLYYSTFFGYSPRRRGRTGAESHPARGITAAIEPASGKILWTTTEYYLTAGCTISAAGGRLYLGGYNKPREDTLDRYVWCLDARDGSLVWQSEPVASSVNVISVGKRFLFSNASGKDGHVIDRETGKILSRFNFKYACTRFACSEPYVLGANLDMIDLSQGNRLITTGPAIDSRECLGSVVSNGRIFYTSQASGLQVSKVYGKEAQTRRAVWRESE